MSPETYMDIINASSEKRVLKLRKTHNKDDAATKLCDFVLQSCYGYEQHKQQTSKYSLDLVETPCTPTMHVKEIDPVEEEYEARRRF